MPRLVHRQMHQLTQIDLPVNEAEFVRMWRTLLLKRSQDIYEVEKQRNVANPIRIDRHIHVPAPMHDILSSIGSFHSNALGVVYHVVPPARPLVIPDWYQIDHDLIQRYQISMNRMKNLYEMRRFPSHNDTKDRSIVLSTYADVEHERSVKALTDEVLSIDAYVRFIHDNMLGQNAIAHANCHLMMSENLNLETARLEYIGAYVIGNNV